MTWAAIWGGGHSDISQMSRDIDYSYTDLL
jgi:hypothetical protein